MFHLATSELAHFLTAYSYRAVLLFVAIESMGIPFPGETMLLVAATYAGMTHRLSPPLVIVAAASGAILGDNLGYWIGREGGYRLLRRYGRYLRLDERKVKLGQYLFRKHGGKVIFFGCFIAVLRSWPEPTACRGLPSCSSTHWALLLFLPKHTGKLCVMNPIAEERGL